MTKRFFIISFIAVLILGACSNEPSLQDKLKQLNILTPEQQELTLYNYLQDFDQEKPILILTVNKNTDYSAFSDSLSLEAKQHKLFSFLAIDTDSIVNEKTYKQKVKNASQKFENGDLDFNLIFNPSGTFTQQFLEEDSENNYAIIIYNNKIIYKEPLVNHWRLELPVLKDIFKSKDTILQNEKIISNYKLSYGLNNYQKIGEWKIENIESKQLLSTFNYKNGKKEGESKLYHKNGQLGIIVFFKNGKENSEYKEYFENGQLRLIKFYKNGKEEGEYKWYFENRQLRVITSYKNGKKEGEYKEYYENGQLRIITSYKNGEEEGEYKWYFENGQLRVITSYKNGEEEGEYKEYFENGQLEIIKFFKNGKRESEYKWYFENGQLRVITSYKNGKKEGEYKKYHDNGNLNAIGNYSNGEKVETWKFYHKNEQLQSIGEYVNGEYNGEWKNYYNNGQLYKLNAWKNGKLIDIYSCFSKKGKALNKGTLVNGNGTVFDFNDSGKVVKTKNYINGDEEENYEERLENEAYFAAISKTKIKLQTPESNNNIFSLTEYAVKKYAVRYKNDYLVSIPFKVPEKGEINLFLQNFPSWMVVSENRYNQAKRFEVIRATKKHRTYIDNKINTFKKKLYVSQGGKNLKMENLRGKTCYIVAIYPRDKYRIYSSNYSLYFGYYRFKNQKEIDTFNSKLKAFE